MVVVVEQTTLIDLSEYYSIGWNTFGAIRVEILLRVVTIRGGEKQPTDIYPFSGKTNKGSCQPPFNY